MTTTIQTIPGQAYPQQIYVNLHGSMYTFQFRKNELFSFITVDIFNSNMVVLFRGKIVENTGYTVRDPSNVKRGSSECVSFVVYVDEITDTGVTLVV